ncbi:MAG: zinc ribbon-containing protein [Pseudomonadales bacterium]
MSPDKQPKSTADNNREHILSGVYDRTLEQLSALGLQTAEYSTEAIHHALDEAIALEQAAEEMTADEVSLLATYLRRDLASLNQHLHLTGEGLASWLNFDLTILEQTSIDRLLALADQSTLQRLALFEKLECSSTQYLAGEICAPGSIRCLNCGRVERYTSTRQITSCAQCHSTYFERKSSALGEMNQNGSDH